MIDEVSELGMQCETNTSVISNLVDTMEHSFTLKDMQKHVEQDILRTLNNGTEKQLRGIKGIGIKRASLIMQFRIENGEFETVC